MKLTKEQQKLVEDNHSLIYYYARKHNLKIEEYYDTLAMALCYAAYHYDPKKGAFSTIALNTMRLKMCNHFRNEHLLKRKIPKENICYYEESFALDEFLPPYEAAEKEALEKIVSTDVVNKIFSLLNDKEKQTVELLLQGYNRREVSKILNITSQNIYVRVKKIKVKLEEAGILDLIK